MLDEKALRRPEWVEGEWVTFADGSRLSLPKPVVELYPVAGPDGALSMGGVRRSFGPAYDALIDAFIAAEGKAEVDALLRLAADLLSRNYDLTVEHYQALLPLRPGDDANRDMWGEVADVAIGRGPKPSPAGAGSPASS